VKTISGPAETTDSIFKNFNYNPIFSATVPLGWWLLKKPIFCVQLAQALDVYERNGIDISQLEDTVHTEDCYYGDQ
jgi:hypothetical protein